MLVEELHGHAAPERVADDRGLRDAQFIEEVAQRDRERAERVVAARFGRLAVAEQVGSDHSVLLRQLGQHRPPGLGTAGHAVDQQQRLAAALVAVRDAVTVQLEKSQLAHADIFPLSVPSMPNGGG